MLSIDQWMMLAIFAGTLIGLVKYQNSPERVFAAATMACLTLSFVTTEQIFNNAINPGLITLILLINCSFAFERTSFLRLLASRLISKSVTSSYVKTLLTTAFASAILNNTAVVATLISPIKNNKFINPGRLLLPLSYAAILGGTLTLVGTSTNLIVNSMLIERGLPSLKFFDFTLVGLAAMGACLLVLFIRIRALPKTAADSKDDKHYFVEAEVMRESKLIGRSIEDNGLRSMDSLFLIEIIRHGHLISPVTPEEYIQPGDKLIFTGDISKVFVLQQFDGLQLFAEQDGLLRDNLTEVLIKPGSAIIGMTLKQAGFRARFDAAVVAIRREGSTLSGKLGDLVIQSGDFLVLAVGNDFVSRTNLTKNFFILTGVEPEDMLSGWRDKFTLFGFLGAISTSVIFEISLLKCLMFYMAALFAFNCLSINEIKRRFPLEIWLIVVSALTLATALEGTGVSQVIADLVHGFLQDKSVMIAFVAVFLITLLLTEAITNNAAAALIFPIAYNIAIGLDANPLPFIMAVAFGASGSFISPYGYQTNVMVYNAGNYRLKDFVKVGLPISITYSAVVLYMIPLIFPFK
ncbi:SLC13 family permease [Thalassotalea psychrophila]|uniref:SLC13 family permease n=1 Tax=Thalassotalea psychrophila TaxID=3065647 RepID=A0ABY9TU40_9GAMM|nr:SLC13 family permease [Colwelliaceae bacterium SQ149]